MREGLKAYNWGCVKCIPGVGFMVKVVGLGSEGPEFKSHSAVE